MFLLISIEITKKFKIEAPTVRVQTENSISTYILPDKQLYLKLTAHSNYLCTLGAVYRLAPLWGSLFQN